MVKQHNGATETIRGTVSAVRGTIVDVRFTSGLPPIDAALECEFAGDEMISAIVHSHLGNSSVRAIATSSTRGMCRGAQVR